MYRIKWFVLNVWISSIYCWWSETNLCFQWYSFLERLHYYFWSSLFYNTNARHERHECHTGDANATLVLHERHECHECYKNDRHENDTSWNVDFDNDTSENIFSYPYNSYITNERLQAEEKFLFKNYLLEMPRYHVKMHLKNSPQKLNFIMEKAKSKLYTRLNLQMLLQVST